MDVSIVIRTKNEAKYIGKTLSRIYEQDYSGAFEIVVVDSGSTDSTPSIARKYDARIICLRKEEFSYGRALNIGAREAHGEIIVNISAHALPADRKWLRRLLEGFSREDIAGVYGKQLSDPNINPFEAFQNSNFFGDESEIFCGKNATSTSRLHFSNANSAVRRRAWGENNFDETVRYGEDYLWQRDILKSGLSIAYASAAVVYHTHGIDVRAAYKNPKNFAYEMQRADQKNKSVLMVPVDLVVSVGMFCTEFVKSLKYLIKCQQYLRLKILPAFVFARSLGWFVGRTCYRLER